MFFLLCVVAAAVVAAAVVVVVVVVVVIVVVVVVVAVVAYFVFLHKCCVFAYCKCFCFGLFSGVFVWYCLMFLSGLLVCQQQGIV